MLLALRNKLRSKLKRGLNAAEVLIVIEATAQAVGEETRKKYSKLITSVMRTPQPESEWQKKFLALEHDYNSLSTDWADTLIENDFLTAENRALKRRMLKWGEVG